jgi:hypothetical protein
MDLSDCPVMAWVIDQTGRAYLTLGSAARRSTAASGS